MDRSLWIPLTQLPFTVMFFWLTSRRTAEKHIIIIFGKYLRRRIGDGPGMLRWTELIAYSWGWVIISQIPIEWIQPTARRGRTSRLFFHPLQNIYIEMRKLSFSFLCFSFLHWKKKQSHDLILVQVITKGCLCDVSEGLYLVNIRILQWKQRELKTN